MKKESDFVIYCMERYRYFKGLSGAEAAKIFEKYDIYGYIIKYFRSPGIQWETIVLCRILMIILPVGQSESALLR